MYPEGMYKKWLKIVRKKNNYEKRGFTTGDYCIPKINDNLLISCLFFTVLLMAHYLITVICFSGSVCFSGLLDIGLYDVMVLIILMKAIQTNTLVKYVSIE